MTCQRQISFSEYKATLFQNCMNLMQQRLLAVVKLMVIMPDTKMWICISRVTLNNLNVWTKSNIVFINYLHFCKAKWCPNIIEFDVCWNLIIAEHPLNINFCVSNFVLHMKVEFLKSNIISNIMIIIIEITLRLKSAPIKWHGKKILFFFFFLSFFITWIPIAYNMGMSNTKIF